MTRQDYTPKPRSQISEGIRFLLCLFGSIWIAVLLVHAFTCEGVC